MGPAFWAASVYLVVLALISDTSLVSLIRYRILIVQSVRRINLFPISPQKLTLSVDYTLKLSPQEQLEVALGLLNLNPPEIKALE